MLSSPGHVYLLIASPSLPHRTRDERDGTHGAHGREQARPGHRTLQPMALQGPPAPAAEWGNVPGTMQTWKLTEFKEDL